MIIIIKKKEKKGSGYNNDKAKVGSLFYGLSRITRPCFCALPGLSGMEVHAIAINAT